MASFLHEQMQHLQSKCFLRIFLVAKCWVMRNWYPPLNLQGLGARGRNRSLQLFPLNQEFLVVLRPCLLYSHIAILYNWCQGVFERVFSFMNLFQVICLAAQYSHFKSLFFMNWFIVSLHVTIFRWFVLTNLAFKLLVFFHELI